MTGDLFSSGTKFSDEAEHEGSEEKSLYEPLASRMRPKSLSEYIGQEHLTGEGMPLRRMAESGHVSSMILWGPPGTGKTTLAKILTNRVNAKSIVISAVTTGIADIREAAKPSSTATAGAPPCSSSMRSTASTRRSRTPSSRLLRTAR